MLRPCIYNGLVHLEYTTLAWAGMGIILTPLNQSEAFWAGSFVFLGGKAFNVLLYDCEVTIIQNEALKMAAPTAGVG